MNNKKFVISFVSVIVLNALIISACFYARSLTKKQEEEAKENLKNYALLSMKSQNLKSLELQAAEIKENAGKLNNFYLKESGLVGFIESLEKTGKDANVLAGMHSAEVEKDKKSVLFRIKAEGGFKELFQYLVSLENLPYQVVIEKMNISKEGAEMEKDGWKSEVDIRIISFLSGE